MTSTPSEDIRHRIADALGTGITERTIVISNRPYVIFEAPASANADWSSPSLESLHAADIRAYFADNGSVLRACWGLSAADVIEVEQVGSYSGALNAAKQVRSLVEEIQGLLSGARVDDSFEVFFADEAGLDIRFRSEIPSQLAREIVRLLLDRSAQHKLDLDDSYIFMHELADSLGLDVDPEAEERGGGAVASLVAIGRLRFWWD